MSSFDRGLARRLGDRHIRVLDALRGSMDESELVAGTIRLSATPILANTIAGQQATWMISNLLARLYGVVRAIEIDVPEAPLLCRLPLAGEAEDLKSAVLNTIRAVADSTMRAVDASVAGESRAVVMEVVVGAREPTTEPRRVVSCVADGWNMFVGDPVHAPDVVPSSSNSVGPFMAACVAVGEVFKEVCKLKEGKGARPEAKYLSLWDLREYDAWGAMPDQPLPALIELPPMYLVGVGAVGQAVLATLAVTPGISGYLTLVDGDELDEAGTNLNRHVLATIDDLRTPKVDVAYERLKEYGLAMYPYAGRWPDYAYDNTRPNQRSDLERLESDFRYDVILSCVDKNAARQAIQNFWPRHLIGGSTLDMKVAVTSYDMESPYECLKCSNPVAPVRPIEDIAEWLADHPEPERRALAELHGADVAAVEAFVSDPECGSLGEQELSKFDAEIPDPSVGFVSVASGVVLAAQAIKKHGIGVDAFPEERGCEVGFNFLNLWFKWSKHLRRRDCQCTEEGAEEYAQLWGAAT